MSKESSYEITLDTNEAEIFLEETRFRMEQGDVFEKEWVIETAISLITFQFCEK